MGIGCQRLLNRFSMSAYPRADQPDTCLSPRQGTIAGMNSAYLELDLVPLVTDGWGHEDKPLGPTTDK